MGVGTDKQKLAATARSGPCTQPAQGISSDAFEDGHAPPVYENHDVPTSVSFAILDGAGDSVAPSISPDKTHNAAASLASVAQSLRPIYDSKDSIEQTADLTNSERQASWQPSRTGVSQVQREVVPPEILSKARVLYDSADMVDDVAKQSPSWNGTYWHPKQLNPPSRLTAIVKSVAEPSGQVLFDTADAVEDIVKSPPVHPSSWQPRRLDASSKAQPLDKKSTPLHVHDSINVVANRSSGRESHTQQQVASDRDARAPEPDASSPVPAVTSSVSHFATSSSPTGPFPADSTLQDHVYEQRHDPTVAQNARLGHATARKKSTCIDEHRTIRLPSASTCHNCQSANIAHKSSADHATAETCSNRPDSYASDSCQTQTAVHDCQCCGHDRPSAFNRKALHNTKPRVTGPASLKRHWEHCSSNSPHRRVSCHTCACGGNLSICRELDETSSTLQIATQSLDRALIGLNHLLDEAVNMAKQASYFGLVTDSAEILAAGRSTLADTYTKRRLRTLRSTSQGLRHQHTTSDSDEQQLVRRVPRRSKVSFQEPTTPVVQSVTSVTIPQGCAPAMRASSGILSPDYLYTVPDPASPPSETPGLGTIVQRGLPRPDSLHGSVLDAAVSVGDNSRYGRDSIPNSKPNARPRALHPLLRGNDPNNTLHSIQHQSSALGNVEVHTKMWTYGIPGDDPQRALGQSDSTGYITERADLKHPRRPHLSIPGDHGVPDSFHHKHKLIARDWNSTRKRITAVIACVNTAFVGLLAGIYAGEVPRIQYQLADLDHRVIVGNVLLYAGIAVTTLLCWPLPLLHGRKPYTIAAFALMLPLQYPQALAVSMFHDPNSTTARVGLLLPRALTGLAMGLANINFLPTLFDLFGASLMSDNPHQEHVQLDDVRRQGGGIGIWLGIWSWCYTASVSVGFCGGAVIIQDLEPVWGFYITIILLALFLMINIVAPETRCAPHRRSVIHIFDHTFVWRRRVAKGEVHLHLWQTGPKWWFYEVWAGIVLTTKMAMQIGFLIMICYFAWIFAQVVLIILLLGALLSRWYEWRSDYVGAAALALAIGALLAVPLTHANWFSRSRVTPPRSNSMTLEHNGGIRLTSHMLRRCMFTLILPLAGLAYTLASPGPEISWTAPVVFIGLVGFLSNLAISECVGLMMETFDTCDLQVGVNRRHREKSLPETVRKARTRYSSFPRVCAGFFAAQSVGFLLAAAATGVSGTITRAIGAQISAASVAGILLVLTILLLVILLRFRSLQVIPNGILDSSEIKSPWASSVPRDADWRPVILGNPSGKMRRVSMFETGHMSRWSEIRRLNGLEQ